MAMKYVPKDKQSEIEAMICDGCRYDNGEDELACCWCQVGSMFEKRNKQSQDLGCSELLKSKCSINCERCICRDCNKRFACDGGSLFFGCGE